MAILTIMYPNAEGLRFDEDYYHARHLPLVREVWGEGLADVRVLHALAGMGDQPPPYRAIVEVEWESMEALQKAVMSPRGTELSGDVANYTDATPVTMLCRKA